ncbi:hypothetical protein [Actinomadura sp. DC4]|uniref:hypothetical protein n=1 Tax=Actinomadura sp. DC4 TaxID=3055069 RepID=UPI0025B0A8EB|nr:hypothetical protein [Actinomadura sp. DC4]MDN3358764.1 hypothetical protein [Actinomadura sp. DC4]
MAIRVMVRLAAGVLAVCAAAGLYVLGRASVPDRQDAAYARGLDDGRAQGVREGRADEEVQALPAGARDPAKTAFDDGYRAGANDLFSGYDGGWDYKVPYLITLSPGGRGITYRPASRTPLHPGVDYYLCPHSQSLCQEPHS